MNTVIEKAMATDLPELNDMYTRVVARMFENGVDLWNDYYPTEELPGDIAANRLYVLKRERQIVAAFAVFDSLPMQHCFDWLNQNDTPLYISRLAVHPDFNRQGLGAAILNAAAQIATETGRDTVRVLVAVENTPAIGLYRKNGLVEVPGQAVEYFASLGRDVIELAFEKRLG